MSDTENQVEQDQTEGTTLPVVDELTKLKSRADLMGLKYHPNIGVDSLRERINAHMAGTPETKPSLEKTEDAGEESEAQMRRRLKDEATALVRINVTCMNPAKREWEGEIFTVANKFLPTQKKFVPFNTTEGYHVPKIIYDMMKARECQIFVTEKAMNGVKIRKGKLIREFSIEVLDR